MFWKKTAAQKQKMFLPLVKNICASRTQILHPKHMFPTLATMKTMLTRFQCCSLKMFPNNGRAPDYKKLKHVTLMSPKLEP